MVLSSLRKNSSLAPILKRSYISVFDALLWIEHCSAYCLPIAEDWQSRRPSYRMHQLGSIFPFFTIVIHCQDDIHIRCPSLQQYLHTNPRTLERWGMTYLRTNTWSCPLKVWQVQNILDVWRREGRRIWVEKKASFRITSRVLYASNQLIKGWKHFSNPEKSLRIFLKTLINPFGQTFGIRGQFV